MPTHPSGAARGRAILLAVSVTVSAFVVHAEPSTPWMPGAAGRHALQLLVDEAALALPVTQWPLPRGAVGRALDQLPRELPPALDAARARVAAELRAAEGAALGSTLRGHDESLAGFGDDATPGHSVLLRSPTWATPRLAVQVGARWDRDSTSLRHARGFGLQDSAIAVEALGIQLQAWSHRSWWGPGWQSSLLLGNNAPAFNGAGLQRASASASTSPWLAWMGPWNAELFVAQGDDAMHDTFVGMRVTLRPLSLLEVGVSRTAQWGGHGRPQTPGSFLRMLVGEGTNPETPSEAVFDPGNGMAGFDARLRCPGRWRCALFGQLIGEDEAGALPSRYIGLYGAEAWSADGRHRWFAELAQTTCGAPLDHQPQSGCAYRNHAYPEGYTHATRWIGAAVGPDSRLLTLGWLDGERGTSLRLHAGRVGSRIGVFSPASGDPLHSGRLAGLGARQSWTWGRAALGAEIDWLRISAPTATRREARAGLQVRVEFDGQP